MNIKDSIKSMSSRDKLLLVVLAFALMFTGLYFVYKDLSETRETLQLENETLDQKRNMVGSIIKSIKPTEQLLEAREVETEEFYAKLYDNYDSPINFERTFLGWLNGRSLVVNSFSHTEPTLETLVYNPTTDTLYPMEEYANELNKYAEGGVVDNNSVDDDFEFDSIEDEDEHDSNYTPDKSDEDDEEITPEAPKATDTYSLLTSTYSYSIQLSEYEYTKLVDEINYFSKYIYLVNSVYTSNPDSGKGSGTFTIKLYSVDKPKQFEILDDHTYFKYNTIKPIIVEPKKDDVVGIAPGNTNTDNNDSNSNDTDIGSNSSDGEEGKGDLVPKKDDENKLKLYKTKTGTKYHTDKCNESHLKDSKQEVTKEEIEKERLEPCDVTKDILKQNEKKK